MSNNQLQSSRIKYLDTVAGFLILHMILGHIVQKANLMDSTLYKIMDIFYFFLPWFFYKSGMFYKNIPIKTILNKGGKKLLSSYILWSVIGSFILIIVELLVDNKSFSSYEELKRIIQALFLYEAVPGNLALWFLLSLFFVHFIFKLLSVCLSEKGIVCISLIIVLINEYLDIHIPVWIVNIPAGLLFFSIGVYLRDIHSHKTAVFLAFMTYLLIWILMPSIVGFRSMTVHCGSLILFLIGSVSGIIVINATFQYFNNIFLFDTIGKKSMIIYVMHWPILTIGYLFKELIGINDSWDYFWLLICFEIVAITIIIYGEKFINFP